MAQLWLLVEVGPCWLQLVDMDALPLKNKRPVSHVRGAGLRICLADLGHPRNNVFTQATIIYKLR